MTDGSVRSLSGVVGFLSDGSAAFAFSPDPLPTDVTSPDEVEFDFVDGAQPVLPTINWDFEVTNFVVEGGVAHYYVVFVADGVRVSSPTQLVAGDSSPLLLSLG